MTDYHGDISPVMLPILRRRFGDVGAERIARFERRKKRRAFWSAVVIALIVLAAVALVTLTFVVLLRGPR